MGLCSEFFYKYFVDLNKCKGKARNLPKEFSDNHESGKIVEIGVWDEFFSSDKIFLVDFISKNSYDFFTYTTKM